MPIVSFSKLEGANDLEHHQKISAQARRVEFCAKNLIYGLGDIREDGF